MPFLPANIALAEAYERLLERGSSSAGEVWDKGAFTSLHSLFILFLLTFPSFFPAVSALFLEISIVLGVSQNPQALRHSDDIARIVQ